MKTKFNSFRILTNGSMRSHVNARGHGGLFQDWIALTRYTEADPDACGPFLYIREGENAAPANLTTDLEVGIAPGLNVEIRKITLTNHDESDRQFELTTCAEIALNHPMGDAGHPAFSKLFVQTSQSGDGRVLMARRRPRGLNENWPWLAQTLVGEVGEISLETNRATFLGRGRTLSNPAAMDTPGALGGETGNVLDPVMAWRFTVSLAGNESKTIWLLTATAADESTVKEILEKCRVDGAAGNFLAEALAAETTLAGRLGIDPQDASRYQALAGVLLAGNTGRLVPSSLAGSDVLHRFPLSGEEIRVIATGPADSEGTLDMVSALPYWNALGLKVRLFVMDRAGTDNPQEGIAAVDPATFSPDQLAWWLASAQLVTTSRIPRADAPVTSPVLPGGTPAADARASAGEPLLHFNGHGGFAVGGREYLITLDLEDGRLGLPPMPWSNVLANPDFGCIVTERGAGYTWSHNSQANRITPWSNDPIRDPHGEALYLRDEESGHLWSPLPGPCAPVSPFVVRHGFGRSRFLSSAHGISQSVDFSVPPDAPVKLVSLVLKNESTETKRLSLSSFHRLLLCSTPDRHHATLAWRDENGIQHAENPRAGDFSGGRVFSFAAVHGAVEVDTSLNQSSTAFLGSGGLESPSALADGGNWTDSPGFGRDACFSRRILFTLPPGAEVEICLGLGETLDPDEIPGIVGRFGTADGIRATHDHTAAYWDDLLGGIRISTPLPEVDLMVNGWLLYQNLACRIWGRSAFYQSGGAFGFRDQLQDSGALAALHPEMMRSQILLHAAQQFPEGDVTHWWHPAPMGTGMRTKFSDDLLWLPYLTDHYLRTTGDHGVLRETLPFIEGPLLGPHEDEEYMRPAISRSTATVFEHCCLAIDKSLATGAHGLPLMGIGDWNDGMSRIGREGRGESVWMAFFLYTILNQWIPRCAEHGQAERVEKYTASRDALLVAINDAGWDGEWYRRAYYDDGTPLGTHTGDECRIDALAQAWAVISKSAPPDRVEKSLDSLEKELIDPEYDIIRLLHPPFVNTPHDPGYIKGYVAGVRENGGQYTHAACWVIRAMAEAGRRDEASRLLQRLSPVWHSRDAAAVSRYQVEPYVVAADIYGAEPHNGRGGWTWYTGSAGWMFRVAVESILGLRVENGDTLVLDPRIPDGWPGYSIVYRKGESTHHIEVTVSGGKAERVQALVVDGVEIPPENGTARWPATASGGEHRISVTLGPA